MEYNLSFCIKNDTALHLIVILCSFIIQYEYVTMRAPFPIPQIELDIDSFLDEGFTVIDAAPINKHPFLFTQQNSIANYVVQQGASFTIDPPAPEINPKSKPVAKTLEIEVPQNPNLTAIALKKQVNAECIQNKDLVNTFFHNVMMHFIFIYLDPERTVFDQLDKFEKDINQGNTLQVIHTLQENRQKLVDNIRYDSKKVIINAANGLNMGGAITYKGKGTVEEDLEAMSDFFLSLLVYHASDSYQRKILVELLGAIKKMLSTKAPLLNTKDECLKHAATWINLIYKNDIRGYYISPHAIHEHPVVFFIANEHVPTLKELPRVDFCPDFMSLRQHFLAHCRIATVLDVVAEDHRLLETKSLQICGLQKAERPASFAEIMNQIEAKLAAYANEYPLKNNPNNLDVIMPLIGCGAFGGKPADFCAPINKNPTQFTKYGQLTLFLRHDTILTCIKLLAPAITQMKTEFNIPFDTIKTWWNSLQMKAVAGEATVQKELTLMNMVIDNNQQIFPRQIVESFCRAELQRIYSSKSESNNAGKLRALEHVCSHLLGEQYEFSEAMKRNLLTAIKASLFIYDQESSFFSKNPKDINDLIKFKTDLAKTPFVSYMDVHHAVSILLKQSKTYHGKHEELNYKPTPTEACFLGLKKELKKINTQLCKQALNLDAQTKEKRRYLVHDFFNSFFTPVLRNTNDSISQHLNAIDVASMACTSKAVTKL